MCIRDRTLVYLAQNNIYVSTVACHFFGAKISICLLYTSAVVGGNLTAETLQIIAKEFSSYANEIWSVSYTHRQLP